MNKFVRGSLGSLGQSELKSQDGGDERPHWPGECSLKYLKGVVKAIWWLARWSQRSEALSTWGGEIKQVKSVGC